MFRFAPDSTSFQWKCSVTVDTAQSICLCSPPCCNCKLLPCKVASPTGSGPWGDNIPSHKPAFFKPSWRERTHAGALMQCQAGPWLASCGLEAHICKEGPLSSSQQPSTLMRCDKDKHNVAASLSLIVYCFPLLRISSLAGISLRRQHLYRIKKEKKKKRVGLVWFAGWFPIQLCPPPLIWWPLGELVMKGLTRRTISFADSGPWCLWQQDK